MLADKDIGNDQDSNDYNNSRPHGEKYKQSLYLSLQHVYYHFPRLILHGLYDLLAEFLLRDIDALALLVRGPWAQRPSLSL
jgi:hypothetical protein